MKKILLFLLFPLSLFAQDGILKTLVAGGSVNVYTIAEALPSAYDQKERWQVIFPSTNTSTVTLQRAGLLVKAIKKPDGTALSANDLIAGSPYLISYNSNAGYYICETCGGGSGGTWGTITGALSSQTDLQSALNAKQATLVSGTNIKTVNSTSLLGSGDVSVGTVTSVATSNGLTGGTITGAGTISGINSAADGSTKGVASFTAADFNASSGNISLDYTNGQAASGSLKGFLSSTDWTTFNNKQNSLTAGIDYEVPLTFNNGLTRTTNTIKLGGAFTATTQIGSNGSGNFVYDNAGTIWNAGSTGLWYGTPGTYTLDYSYAAVSDKTVEIGARTQSVAKNAFLTISGVGGVQPTIKISGSTGFAGLQEAADYSANYNSLSHISKGYAVATFAPIAINGTVTSISTTSPITGGPVTTVGTIACATCVTSAASLTSNALVIGGGSQASSTITTGSGVITALGINTGSAGAFIVNGGAAGTFASGIATNLTGLPLTTGVTGILPAVNGGAGTINGVLKANGSGTVSAAAGSDINTTFGSQTANTFYGSPDGSSGNPTFRAISRNDLSSAYTKVGQVFTEPWTNLTNWTNVGTPSAAVSGGYLTLSGTASTSTNYVKNNSYGKFNLEAASISWTEVVGTVGASTSGIGFGLVSQNTLFSTAFANSMMVNIELSTTTTGAVKWYFGSGTVFTVAQTSTALLVPVAGDVLNITLTTYPDKYELTYNINGGVPFHDTFIAYTGGQEGASGLTTVVHNAAAFSFFNVGGGSSHKVGAVTVKSLHNKNARLLVVGNSIASGYGCANLYNRAVTKTQKRTYSTIEVNARPSNSILDVNAAEIAAYNATEILLMCATTNDLTQKSVATTEADLATVVTALGAISNAAAPTGYTTANGNLKFSTELPRAAISASITTINTDLPVIYGAANVINLNALVNNGGTAMQIPSATGALATSFDAVHPNDYGNGLMADELIRFYDFVRKDVYENEDVAITNIASPKGYNTVLNHTSGITIISSMNSSREKYLSFSGYGTTNGAAMTAAIRSAQAGGENVLLGQTTAGFGIWANSAASNTYAATKRFHLDYSGNIATGTTASVVYRNTNAGSNVSGHMIIDPASSLTAGVAWGFSTADGLFATQGNATRRILGAAINPVNLTSTAGSEAMGLGFYTQTGGAAAVLNMNLSPSGKLFIGGSTTATAFLHLAAETATANTAPLKFTAPAALLTSPEAVTLGPSINGDYLNYTTTTGTVRRVVVAGSTGRATAQTAANASVATYTLGATDATYEVSANILVTTSSAENFTTTVTYTDEGNTARTLTFNFQTIGGTIGTAINFANGAVPYEGIPVHLRCKASTAITIKTTGTFTGATYNVEGLIKQTQ